MTHAGPPSELVTNAVRHGASRVELSVGGGRIRVDVCDEGAGRPVLRSRLSDPDTSPGGWGLRMLDRLADAWGSQASAGQTLVWFERRTSIDSPAVDVEDLRRGREPP